MALRQTGRAVDTETSRNFQVNDDEDRIVVVKITREVLQDKDWSDIWRVADTKYDEGVFSVSGDIRIVDIRTTDFDGA